MAFRISQKLAVLFLLSCPMLVLAETASWDIDPKTSTLSFVGVQNDAPTKGEFKKFSGSIRFDPAHLDQSRVDIKVDLNSTFTSFAQIADTLKTADWFDVKLFPEADFKADKFSKTGENSYRAEGTLTLRDKTQPITLNFDWKDNSKNSALVKGSTIVKRTLFNVGAGEWADTSQVKDDVQVSFELNVSQK